MFYLFFVPICSDIRTDKQHQKENQHCTMGKSTRRSVFDPTLAPALDDTGGGYYDDPGPDPLSLQNSTEIYNDVYDNEQQEILDPKLHRRRTTGASGHNSTARWCCLSMLVAFGALAIIVTVGVIVSRNNKGDTYVVYTNPLAAPPAQLGAWCDRDNMDAMQCAKACAPADCCDIPPQYDLSCLVGNEVTCFEYHKDCLNLKLGGVDLTSKAIVDTIPKAQPNLPGLCSFETLAETRLGENKCRTACAHGSCCYEEGVPPCSEQSRCTGYVPCFNLRAYDTALEEDDDALDDDILDDDLGDGEDDYGE